MSKVYMAVSGYAGTWSEYISTPLHGFVDAPGQSASWMRRFQQIRQQADEITPDGVIMWTLHPQSEGSMMRFNWRNAAKRADQALRAQGAVQTMLGDISNLVNGCLWWSQNARGLTFDLYMGVPDAELLGLMEHDAAFTQALVTANIVGFNMITRTAYVDSLELLTYPGTHIPVGPPLMRALRARGIASRGVEPLPFPHWDLPANRNLISKGLITRAAWQTIDRSRRMQNLQERVIFYSNADHRTYADMIEQLQAGHSIAVMRHNITDMDGWREVLAARIPNP